MPTDYAAIDALIERILDVEGIDGKRHFDGQGPGPDDAAICNWGDLQALVEAAQAESLKRTATLAAALKRVVDLVSRNVNCDPQSEAEIRGAAGNPNAILAARDLRMKRIGAALELEDAADEMDARRKQDIGFTPGDLRARAAELRKLAEEEK